MQQGRRSREFWFVCCANSRVCGAPKQVTGTDCALVSAELKIWAFSGPCNVVRRKEIFGTKPD